MTKKKKTNSEYVTLPRAELESMIGTLDFEASLYYNIANSIDFEILPLPDENGRNYSPETLKNYKIELNRQGIKLLYRISYGNYAIIVNPDDLGRMGMVPESNNNGFLC